MLELWSLNEQHYIDIDIDDYNKMKMVYRQLGSNALKDYIKENIERLNITLDEAEILQNAIILGCYPKIINGDTEKTSGEDR
jgi:hypothetical protein